MKKLRLTIEPDFNEQGKRPDQQDSDNKIMAWVFISIGIFIVGCFIWYVIIN